MNDQSPKSHHSVLLPEVLTALAVRADGRYIDATFGRGGHSAAILAALSTAGRLLALDRDPQAIAVARERAAQEPRLQVAHAEFSHLTPEVRALGWMGQVDGILLDLGVSSPQLDQPERGFSFSQDGPLDMRMNPHSATPTAAQWLATVGETELAEVLWEFGEERFSRRIARALVTARRQQPLQRTGQVAAVIAAAHPAWESGRHPATRNFQALRIFINRELEELEAVLTQIPAVLAPGGRVAIISFHSLEDRRVKRSFRDWARGAVFPRGVPVQTAAHVPLWRLFGPYRPSAAEVVTNPRARSAVLRVAEKAVAT